MAIQIPARTRALLLHDLVVFASIFVPLALENQAGLGGLVAVAATAAKVFLRLKFPAPAKESDQ